MPRAPQRTIVLSDFEGKVTPKDLGFNGEINIESDSDILEANLNSGLTLNNNNGINTVPMVLQRL